MLHYFFQNFREANDWLEFDCNAEEAERFQHAWPDQYAEWASLANRWEKLDAEGHELEGRRGAFRS